MISGPEPESIKNLFSSVAHRYDWANDVMTFGMARSWRKKLVAWSAAKPGDFVLDCATGTGDLAIAFKRAVGPAGKVIGTDFCVEMLNLGPRKANQRGLAIDFRGADVTKLPFADQSFDICSIAYGIRNVADPVKALREMARVTKPGGRVMVLETGEAPESALKSIFEFYVEKVIPHLGGWITGQKGAYEYLNESSRRFPSCDGFLKIMDSTKAFKARDYRVLMAGASYLYRGIV